MSAELRRSAWCSTSASARPRCTPRAGCRASSTSCWRPATPIERDDAVWLRTTPYGDDKDRVLIRSNEQPTYFAADIAYHEDKLARGYEHLINIWGADHHGYVPRMKAAVEILSHDPDMLELIIGQLVNLLEAGELRQMSTRRGEMVTLGELIDAIGVDAARFFLVMRSQDQTLDLDIDLARAASRGEPGLLRAVRARTHREHPAQRARGPEPRVAGPRPSSSPRRLRAGPDQEAGRVRGRRAGRRRAPGAASDRRVRAGAGGRLPRVLQELPGDRLGAGVASPRLALCLVSTRVIARCLDLLGVSAPESM